MTNLDFDYDTEVALSIPDGIPCAPIVKIEVSPTDAACVVYGYKIDGTIDNIILRGSQEKLELPFVSGKIYIKFLNGLTNIKIHTLGWIDLKRQQQRQGQ